MIRRSFLMLVGSAVLLSACGFKLRGQQDYAFKRLFIAGAPPAAAARLTRLVEAGSDTKIVKTPDEADAVLNLAESRGQGTLTLDRYGMVQEYQLNYSLNYTLLAKDGTALIPPSVIALNRAMTYSAQYTNAKAQEAEILFNDMQNDAIDQLMRRLAIVRTLHPEPGKGVPAVAPRAPLPPPPL
ncbi:LPS assembly lipoprotein LptE [Burkholderia thailandensis]|uniref:LPS-assembly lipoprotein LptE n=2 Tax=Burkholderia thailandensis TaxID=57975 RepID=A0AAW9D1M5_BURTH|nr:LPS assembly lipoprotein LptE [Burkholderia thailandensis]AHI63264.1 lipopolysaccharide-assembly family protein [Burkholderia thailandensis H0587]AHI73660.1 lipopolysaccharide-assembly family protein [Burkholderia thailandensis 2002721723]AHI80154.1 lipopolysaccharide-assembly family protein [Burkholderia thailandensis E444]AIC86126.1 lipopolysaccharide-assembly family protein [Burkholderia thailandensis USAMRU Malaysia \